MRLERVCGATHTQGAFLQDVDGDHRRADVGPVRLPQTFVLTSTSSIVINDIRFEAAFLRAGVLVGLVHEREVPAWAMDAMAASPGSSAQLAEVVLAPIELSAMREALRPIGEGVCRDRVTMALLIAVAQEPASNERSLTDRLRILGHIRREYSPPATIATAIKNFEDRAMLAAAGMSGETAPSAGELATWLDGVREAGYFSFAFRQEEEAAAFVAALSRKIVRDRTWRDQPRPIRARAWVIREFSGEPHTVILNERAWQTAVREFAPVPLASRIPHATLPSGATEVFDEVDAAPFGVDEARRKISS